MAARYETLQEEEVIVPNGKGHTTASAEAAMLKWGKNEIPEEKEPLWKMFVMQFVGTMPAMVRPAPCSSHHTSLARHTSHPKSKLPHKRVILRRRSRPHPNKLTLARRLRSPVCSPSASGRTSTSGLSSPCS